MVGWLSRIGGIVVAVAAALLSPTASARGGDVQDLTVCIARVAAGDTPDRMFAAGDRFTCDRAQGAFGPGSYWVRAQTLPVGAGSTLSRLRSNSQWQDRLTLYARHADGGIDATTLDGRAMTEHMTVGAEVEIALAPTASPLTGLLWRIDGSANFRRILGDPILLTPDASAERTLVEAVLNAAFAGLGFALLIYNLTLWVALRRPFQLAYCAMVASLMLYTGMSSCAIGPWLPVMPNNLRTELTYLLLPVNTAAALWFARTVFDPYVLPRRLVQAIGAVIATLLGAASLFAILAPWQMHAIDRVIGLAYVAVIGLTVPLLWQAWRRSPVFLLIFALGWSAPVMLAMMRVANTFHVLPYYFQLEHMMIIVVTVEALLSSVAIAYRIHLLGRERDVAREQEIAARLLADTDPLTGLLNRRAFLRQAIGRAEDQMLLIVDIDHFKRVNETIGHDGGDEVLRVVARALRGCLPPGALLARIGGEEFAIVTAADAGLVPATILHDLRAQRMPYDIAVTASIGTCTGPLARETDWKALYRRADRALFAAKAAGRDRARDASTLSAAA